MEHVEKDAEVQEQLGTPLRLGRWWNAAVGVRPGRQAADCSMQLSGAKHDGNATLQVRACSKFRPWASARAVWGWRLPRIAREAGDDCALAALASHQKLCGHAWQWHVRISAQS